MRLEKITTGERVRSGTIGGTMRRNPPLAPPSFVELALADCDPGSWQKLTDRSSEVNCFYQPWCLRPALAAFDPAGKVRLFTYWQGAPNASPLLGLMPLAAQSRYSRWPLPHAQNWLHANSFLGTPLVARGHEQQFWRELLAHLDRTAPTLSFLHLNMVALDSPVMTALEAVCTAQKRRHDVVEQAERAVLSSPLAPAAYYETHMRGKKRKELRRQRSRLDELGDVRFIHGPPPDEAALAYWLDEFLTLELGGWKGKNGSALASDDITRQCFIATITGAHAAGKLHTIDMRLDGRPLAMLINFIDTPGGFSFKTAFDEEYARYSPGVQLQIENLGIQRQFGLDWVDSCAAADHPMIDSIWAERRRVGRLSVALDGAVRRAYFHTIRRAESFMAARKSEISPSQAGET